MTHLFLFTIGPVQSFIAQARKTQDLYAGSQLLSDLMEDAMNWMIDHGYIHYQSMEDNDLIFPDLNVISKPNRFVSFVSTDDVVKMGQDLSEHIQDKVLEYAQPLFDFKKEEHFNQLIIEHLKDYFKTYWVARKVDKTTPYSIELYQRLERDLGMVKNVRAFKQLSGKGRKCSVNGEYNVLFYRKSKGEVEGYRSQTDFLLKRKLFAPSEAVNIIDPFFDNSNALVGILDLSYLGLATA